jgi:hypothetical protein
LEFGVWNSKIGVENSIIGVKDTKTKLGNMDGGDMNFKIGVENRETKVFNSVILWQKTNHREAGQDKR